MPDAIVATLAVGRRYADMAAAFLGQLVAAGNAALAVSDLPAAFADTGVEVLPWTPEAPHIWHGKRHAVRAGLARAGTVYFMDADHARLQGAAVPQLPVLVEGLHANFWRVPLAHVVLAKAGRVGDPPAADWIGQAAEGLGITSWQSCLWWWGDHLWAISRDGAGRHGRFCDAWDRFAAWTVEHPCPWEILAGDGVAMAFAAHLAGYRDRIPRADFRDLCAAFAHDGRGAWRR